MNNVRLKDSVQEKFFQNDIPPGNLAPSNAVRLITDKEIAES